jgi:hypothetical protein
MNPTHQPIHWPTPGIIYSRGNVYAVYVRAPLLCLNLPLWVQRRLDLLREQARDPDFTPLERREFAERARFFEEWLEIQEDPIPFGIHEMMSVRSEATPWVVNRADLDDYIENHLLPLSVPFGDGSDPGFLLWSDQNEATLYASAPNLLRSVVECPSPDVETKSVTQDELYARIGQMVVARRDLARAKREAAKKQRN